MKKRDLLSVAMIGVSASLLMGACQAGAPNNNARGQYSQGNYDQDFYNSLSPDYRKRFDQLDERSRADAMKYYRDNGSKDANKAIDMQMKNMRRTSQAEATTAEKAEVATTAAPAEKVHAAPAEAEKVEKKVSSATSTATTTVQ